MDKDAMVVWFGNLPREQKVAFLLDVMHELTIVVRSMFHDHADDCEMRSKAAYDVSELNHRLTSAALAILGGEPTYSDAALIEMLAEPSSDSTLLRYVSFASEQAFRRLSGRQA